MKRRHYLVCLAVVVVAVVFAALPVAAPASATLAEVAPSHPYYEAIAGMAALGALTGYEPASFPLDETLTRAQFAEMLAGTLRIVDGVTGANAAGAIQPAIEVSNPEDDVTRAQSVTLLVKAVRELLPGLLLDPPSEWEGILPCNDPTHGLNVRKAEYNFILERLPLRASDLNAWDASTVTRGEAAQLLWNLARLATPHDPPSIETVSPSLGDISGGTPVTITGIGFTHVTKVVFGEVETWFRVDSETQITTAAPPPLSTGPASTVDVRVFTRSGESDVIADGRFSYGPLGGDDRPSVETLAPASGSFGTRVTITGSGFSDATAVMFGGLRAASFTVDSPTQITAAAPAPWAAGPLDDCAVTVGSPAGVSRQVEGATFSYEDGAPAEAASGVVHVPILMYHHVDARPSSAGESAASLTVRTADFLRQMQYLSDNGYHAVTLDDIYLASVGATELPDKPVALTFDDGGLDNYEVVLPLLEERGFRATFFVITKSVGTLGHMEWDQLREMAAAGMSIQSHSVSHRKLTVTSDFHLPRELENSRAAIAREIGRPAFALAYPGGNFDDRVTEAARAAGYLIATTTESGSGFDARCAFETGRLAVTPSMTLTAFAALLDRR